MTHPVRLFFFLQKRAFQRLSAAGGRAALRADGRGRLPAACFCAKEGCPLALIQIEHLSFSYPSSYDPIFEDVSLRLDTSWKLGDRKSTRLNSSHVSISYAVFCLKKKT